MVHDQFQPIYKYLMKNFKYISWAKNDNKALEFKRDKYDTVEVTTSVGPYKNVFADLIFDRNECYYWEIRIIKGTNFKIGT